MNIISASLECILLNRISVMFLGYKIQYLLDFLLRSCQPILNSHVPCTLNIRNAIIVI